MAGTRHRLKSLLSTLDVPGIYGHGLLHPALLNNLLLVVCAQILFLLVMTLPDVHGVTVHKPTSACCMPQGSVLGPLLRKVFFMMIHAGPRVMPRSPALLRRMRTLPLKPLTNAL